MTEAVAYARYSSDNQRAESITAQLRAIHKYAINEHIDIVKEYIDEAETATSDERPDFQRMIKELDRTKPDLVLVHKLDRFARDRIDSGHYRWVLKKRGVRLIAVDQDFGDTPEASLMAATVEGVAEYFSKNLSREVKKGLYENVQQGMHCGGIPPLGYDIGPDKKYVINEYEAQAVKLIFEMKTARSSYPEIMRTLNENGYRTKKGQPFGKNSLHDILRNEKYIGTYVYRKTSEHSSRVAADPLATINLANALPRIIDDETFYKVQELLDGRKCQPRSRTDTVYLLSGIARCAECGQAMVGDSWIVKGRRYYVYRCNNAKRTRTCSNSRKYNKDKLETDIINQVQVAINHLRQNVDQMVDEIYEEVCSSLESESQERNETKSELAKVQKELNNLITSIAAGVDPAALAPAINTLNQKKTALENKMKRINSGQINKEMIKTHIDKVISKAVDPADPIACRDDLKELLGGAKVGKDGIIVDLSRLGIPR